MKNKKMFQTTNQLCTYLISYNGNKPLVNLGESPWHHDESDAPQLSSSLSGGECECERALRDTVVSVVEVEVGLPILASWNGTGRVASKQVLSFTCYGDGDSMR